MLLTMQNFIKLCPRVNVSLGLYCYILFRSLLRHCCCYLLSKVVRKPTLPGLCCNYSLLVKVKDYHET